MPTNVTAASVTPAPHYPENGLDVFTDVPADFRLESGEALPQNKVFGRIYGPLDAPVVVAAGGISAGRHLYAKEDAGQSPGWWDGVAGPGLALDLDRWRVLVLEFAPEPPLYAPITITTRDQARLAGFLLDRLEIGSVHLWVGASYGAMIGMAFAAVFGDRLARLCAISAAHRAHPMATAMRGIQRRILQFGVDSGRPEEAVALARELAMTTYRTEDEFLLRFSGAAPAKVGESYPVCDYLVARGKAYGRSPNRWISLSDSLDRHDVDPAEITCETWIAAVPGDRLVPFKDSQTLAEALGPRGHFIELHSIYGHDAFLKENAQVSKIVRAALED